MIEQERISDELLLESVQQTLLLNESAVVVLVDLINATLPEGLSEVEVEVFNTVKQEDITQFFDNPYFLELMEFYQSLLTYLPYM